MLRFGVFATIRGWLVARADGHEFYRTRDDAMQSAVRQALAPLGVFNPGKG